jgi:hypothetical protein
MNADDIWRLIVSAAVVIVTLGLLFVAGVGLSQATPSAGNSPTLTPEGEPIAAVVDDDLRVLSYSTQPDGTMRIVLDSDARQDVVVSEVVDDPEGGGQKFAIRAIEAPADGKRVIELPASGGATIVTRGCRDSGQCVFLPADEGGGDLWPNAGRDAVSAGVAILLMTLFPIGLAYRKRRNPNKCESAHDSSGGIR